MKRIWENKTDCHAITRKGRPCSRRANAGYHVELANGKWTWTQVCNQHIGFDSPESSTERRK